MCLNKATREARYISQEARYVHEKPDNGETADKNVRPKNPEIQIQEFSRTTSDKVNTYQIIS